MTQVTATGNGYILYTDVWESSYNASTNTSVLSYQLALRADTSPSGFSGYSPNTSATYIVINGVGTFYSTAGQRTVNRGSTVTFFSGSVSVSHDSNNGAGSWSFYGRLLMQNPYPGLSYMPPDMTTGTGTAYATTFTGPSQPGTPTLERVSNGAQVNATSQTPSAGSVAISKYQYIWSYDNATWNGAYDMSGTSASFNPTATSTVYVQTRAISTTSYGWGTGPWSGSSSIIGIPTVPASISAVREARNVTVTAGSSSGSGITGYFVQYSTNAGSTWSTAQAMTSQSYTYTNLTAALTYRFRVYSTNSTGNSDASVSSDIFVPAGGKRYNGSAFVSMGTAKRWNGTAWVDLTTAKRWNGTSWADLS